MRVKMIFLKRRPCPKLVSLEALRTIHTIVLSGILFEIGDRLWSVTIQVKENGS
jgi:hypothetical protein